jgi:hypothetical protein
MSSSSLTKTNRARIGAARHSAAVFRASELLLYCRSQEFAYIRNTGAWVPAGVVTGPDVAVITSTSRTTGRGAHPCQVSASPV